MVKKNICENCKYIVYDVCYGNGHCNYNPSELSELITVIDDRGCKIRNCSYYVKQDTNNNVKKSN